MKSLQLLANHIADSKIAQPFLYRMEDDLIRNYYDQLINGKRFDNRSFLLEFKRKDKKIRSVSQMKEFIEDEFINAAFLAEYCDKELTIFERTSIKISKLLCLFYSKLYTTSAKFKITLAERIHELAVEYEMPTIKKEICRHILRIYSGTKETRKINHFAKLYTKYSSEYELHQRLDHYFSIANSYHVNSTLVKNAREVKNYIDECDRLILPEYSHVIHDRLGYLKLFYFWACRDFQKIVEVCQDSLLILQTKKHADIKLSNAFHTNRAIAFIYLGRYDKATEVIKNSRRVETRGSHNWCTHQLAYVAACCYSQNYSEAYEATCEVINHKNFKKLRDRVIEEWHLVSAFMSLLIKAGLINPNDCDKKIKGFRVNKFLNEVPKYSKDKRTINATILIAHICHLILDKKNNQAFDRIEAIEKYSVRHLRKSNESFRLNCFLKMLLEIPKAGFHATAARRKAQKYREKLDHVSIADTGQHILAEIVPFTQLWEIVLDSLGRKRPDLIYSEMTRKWN